jgi:transposase
MRFLVTEEDMQRFRIMNMVKSKKLKLYKAAKVLNISYRHAVRLHHQFKKSGLEGLVKKYNNKNKNRKITEITEKKICNLFTTTYHGFNIKHFTEKLNEYHKIGLSDESVRLLLIKHQLHVPTKRRKIYRRRRRMPKAGLLVQMDSSVHHWLPNVKNKWYLIAPIDDATNEVATAEFVPLDTTYANMRVIRALIEKKGLFEALYVDKASHFVTVRHKGLHQDLDDQHKETNIEQALKELGINLITANSPQAKGRVERLFRFLQDRLINEMRLHRITSYKQANEFLKKKFLPEYNKKYSHKAESMYRSIPDDTNLDLVFATREWKKVRKDNTIRVNGEIIQLPPNKLTLSYIKAYVDVRIREDRTVYILYKNKIILITKLKYPVRESMIEKREQYLSKKILA